MRKRFLVVSTIFFVFTTLFLEVSLTKYYPKILSLNNDGQNEILFIRYKNDEGKKIKLKIYDVNNVNLFETITHGSTNEYSEGDEYVYKCYLGEIFGKEKLLPGLYIFILTADEQQIIGKGVLVVIR